MDLRDKVVLITGASSGIGEALARELARRGASLVLTARRTDRLEALATELERDGARSITVACDVTKDGDLENATARAVEAFGRVDVVVANAGFGVGGPLESLTIDDYRRQFETNVFGVLRTIYASLEPLKKSRGTLVLMGSVGSYIAGPGASSYAMSKFAIRALADSLRGELAPHGVGVVLVNPGFVASEFRQVDNEGVHDKTARDPIPAWLQAPAAAAAREIANAIARETGERIVTGHGKVMVLVQRFAPSVMSWALRRRAQSG
jgi:short-subunit dehydrogenase